MHGGRDGRINEQPRARGRSRYHTHRAVIAGIAVPTSIEASQQTNRAAQIDAAINLAIPVQVPCAPTGPDRRQ